MDWIKTASSKPNDNEEVLTYHEDYQDYVIMIYSESQDGEYYSFIEDGEVYYPEWWARLSKPKESKA